MQISRTVLGSAQQIPPSPIPLRVQMNINQRGENSAFNSFLRLLKKYGHSDIVQALKRRKINYQNREGITALMFATQSNSRNKTLLVEMLLRAGANPNLKQNETGSFALMQAVEYESKDEDLDDSSEIIKLLIAHRADINLKDAEGKTALMISNKTAYTTALLKAGANLELRCNQGFTALGRAHYRDVAICLAEHGASVDVLCAKYGKVSVNREGKPQTVFSTWGTIRIRIIGISQFTGLDKETSKLIQEYEGRRW